MNARQLRYLTIRPGDICDCGNPAKVVVQCCKICQRCRNLQMEESARQHRKQTAGQREKRGKGVHMRMFAEFDKLETRFKPIVQFINNTLTVDAHGHYEIAA